MSYYIVDMKAISGDRQPGGPFIRMYLIPRQRPHKELIP